MAKIAIAKIDSIGTEVHEAQAFSKGDVFEVIEEPRDFHSFMVLMALRERGQLDESTLVAFEDGFIVFKEVGDDKAWGIHDYFEIKEAN